jgi:hypothetical protein
MSKAKPHNYNSIPKSVELFGRLIKTSNESTKLNLTRNFGEARYGLNQIALAFHINGEPITPEETKITYLHEMLHFILNFTGYEMQLREKGIDIEQFIELMASAIFQYEKTAKY